MKKKTTSNRQKLPQWMLYNTPNFIDAVVLMTNNDLLNLYNLEKRSYDFYGTCRTSFLLGWVFNLIINISSNFYDSKHGMIIFVISNFVQFVVFAILTIQREQAKKRVSQIMKMLLNKNP